ncbi:capsid protein [Paenalkalicoccus suaedae]|uniref:Capsid protein n=1 Tax=Paenalkalicoccus suaedae TaxID=2592382 RepID=A0A859FFV7_9BACI|nr:capsid protein [Paenalkalicoccus suaedae]QKS71666.1 capsid protein [Paenalkalicoccus suaedae]QKS71720.1 capsid protein [Paenalkalicoccus suaedae]
MAELNYAELYQKTLEQKFSKELMFVELYNSPNNSRIRFTNAKTIQIPRIDVTGMTDTNRDAITGFTRKVDNDWETKTLDHDREFSTFIDPMDVDETNDAVTIANTTRVFNEEQKIPEMDKYMASKLYAEATGFGVTPVTTALSEANALQIFDQMMEDMDEAEVPAEGRILYVTPVTYTILKNAEKLERTIQVQANNGAINRSVRSLDDVQLKRVPSSRMKTVYDFTVGAVADDEADQINMILVHPRAVLSPMKYEQVLLGEPSALSKGKRTYYERSYWDVFVFERKAPAVAFHTTPSAEEEE